MLSIHCFCPHVHTCPPKHRTTSSARLLPFFKPMRSPTRTSVSRPRVLFALMSASHTAVPGGSRSTQVLPPNAK